MIQLTVEYHIGRYLADLLDMKGIKYVIDNLEALTKGSTEEYIFDFETQEDFTTARYMWKNLRFATLYGGDAKTIKQAMGGKKETLSFINTNEAIFSNLKAKLHQTVNWRIEDDTTGVGRDYVGPFPMMLEHIKEEGLTSVGKLKAYLLPQDLLVAQFGKQTGLWIKDTFRGYIKRPGC